MSAVTEEILLDWIRSGRLIEDSSQATERYIEGLKRTLIVSSGHGAHKRAGLHACDEGLLDAAEREQLHHGDGE